MTSLEMSYVSEVLPIEVRRSRIEPYGISLLVNEVWKESGARFTVAHEYVGYTVLVNKRYVFDLFVVRLTDGMRVCDVVRRFVIDQKY